MRGEDKPTKVRGDGRMFHPSKKRADGTIYVSPVWSIAYVGPKKGGTWGEIRETTGETDERKARNVLRERLLAVANHRKGIRAFQGPEQERMTVKTLIDALEADYRNREIKSLRQMLVHMAPVREFFDHRRAVDVSPDLVREFIKERQDAKLANATINRGLEILSAAYNLAIKEGRLSRRPFIPSLPENNARKDFFEKDDFEKLLPNLPEPLREMARFAYFSGWRKDEIRPLRWSEVDRDAHEVRLLTSKNGEGRVLPLDPETWAIFERQWEGRRFERKDGTEAISEYVFHVGGEPLNYGTMGKQWRAAITGAGLPPEKKFHGLRRTAARNMVRAGTPETVAMSITGHKTRAMFDRYNISSSDDKLAAMEKLREHVAKLSSKSKVESLTSRKPKKETA